MADNFKHFLHRFAAADDPLVIVFRFQQRFIGNHLPHIPRRLERVEHNLFEPGNIEGLEQVIVGAQLHGLDGGLRRPVSRHHDDHLFGVHLAQSPQRFQPAHPPHAHIHDHQVGFEPRKDFQPLLAAVGRRQFDVGLVKNAAEGILHVRFVINQEHFIHMLCQNDKRPAPRLQCFFCPGFQIGASMHCHRAIC